MSGTDPLEVPDPAEWSGGEAADPVPAPLYVAPASSSARAGVDLSPTDWGAAYLEHYTRTYIGPVDELVVHHTASSYPATPADVPATLRALEAYGHGRDGADVEYHGLICHGLFAEGFAPRYRGCHCVQSHPAGSSFNSHAFGVAVIGYYYPPHNHVVRPADMDALARWVAARVADGDLSPAVFDRAERPGDPGWYGHWTTGAATACPGTVLDELADTMARARALYLEGDDVALTDDQAFQLQSVYQQVLTPFEEGSPHEGLTPRWAWAAPLTDEDVDRIAAAVVARLEQT